MAQAVVVGVLTINFTHGKLGDNDSIYRSVQFRKPGLLYEPTTGIPFFTQSRKFDDGTITVPFTVLTLYDDSFVTEQHEKKECTSDQCGHACRDLLFNKDISGLFVLTTMCHDDRVAKEINSSWFNGYGNLFAMPSFGWKIPEVPSSLKIRPNGYVQTSSSDYADLDIEWSISKKDIGGICFLIRSEAFESSKDLGIKLAEFRNTFFQMMVRDPDTSFLPCVILVVVKNATKFRELAKAQSLSRIKQSLDVFSSISDPIFSSNEEISSFNLTPKISVELVLENTIQPGMEYLKSFEQRCFQQLRAKLNSQV